MFSASRRAFRRTRDALLVRWGILDWLRLLWCSVVLWCEYGSFHLALRSCSWPDTALRVHHETPAHVLLVADLQVRDPSTSRRLGYSALRQSLIDLVLKRHWHFAVGTSPDVVIFLGDLLAPLRLIRSDEEYERNERRFKSLFHLPRGVTSFYVPGNNDVGLNIDPAQARQARHRWTTHFGPLKQATVLRNHTLVMVDAAGLAEEDYQRAARYTDYEQWPGIPHGSVEFLRALQGEHEKQPTVLFTHIPLHRPDNARCGPLREKGNIQRGVGPGYQNTLGKKTSAFLLQTLHPSLIFSADDKDYCDYMHVPPKPVGADVAPPDTTRSEAVREITLKTFSPSQGLRYPGFELLSLASPSQPGVPSVADTPCMFPDYTSVYTWRYPPLVLLTTLALIILRLRKPHAPPLPQHTPRGALRMSISLHTLPPTIPWPLAQGPGHHPPTPFAPDWSFQTPGFATPRAHSPRASFSPTDEIPHTVRTPLPLSNADGKANGHAPTPMTPTFRAATTTTTGAGLGSGLPPRLLAFASGAGADEEHEHDEFARGRHDPRRLTRAARGHSPSSPSFAHGRPLIDFTFELGGVRRRLSVGNPLPAWARRLSLRGWEGAGRARGGGGGRRRAFVRRVGLDLGYVAWPAGVLWAVCAWWLT